MYNLRNYQVEISHNILNYLNDVIILPTGTGKTAVAISAIRNRLFKAGLCLWELSTPRNSVDNGVPQLLQTWSESFDYVFM